MLLFAGKKQGTVALSAYLPNSFRQRVLLLPLMVQNSESS